MTLRPVDLARAAGIGTQQIRRYEAIGILPPAERTATGYRIYTQDHLEALLTARAVLAGFGWQQGVLAMLHLSAGSVHRAFAVADRAHLEIHDARRRVLRTLTALESVDANTKTDSPRASVGIRRAAEIVGVEVSALRHWEHENLIHPPRDVTNGYRRFDAATLKRVQLVAELRRGGYSIPDIHTVLTELTKGDVSAARQAASERLEQINEASIRCAAATAALWTYHHSTARKMMPLG